MVDVFITADEVILRPKGLHRLLAFKREVRIQRSELRAVVRGVTEEARARLRRSLRLPGTSLPGLHAGSYRRAGQWAFWDVAGNGENALTLSTEGNRYAELVVDVEDPAAVAADLRRAMDVASRGR
jgi:hypothetical protein